MEAIVEKAHKNSFFFSPSFSITATFSRMANILSEVDTKEK